MGVDGILSRASTRWTLDDVKERRVDVETVISTDELESLIKQQVDERTAALTGELDELRARLNEAESGGGGGLERAAADAALQAEAAALEAKAAAELRAEQAEGRVAVLEVRLKELESGSGGGRTAELEARVKELEAQLAAKPAPAPGPRKMGDSGGIPRPDLKGEPATAKVPLPKPPSRETGKAAPPSSARPEPAKPEAARAEAAPGRPEPAKPEAAKAEAAPAKPPAPSRPEPKAAAAPTPVTEEDHARAMRTARGLIEDVISEDEEDARKALVTGSFREKYASALGRAKQSYERRVKDAVRSARDHWDMALKEAEEKAKK